MQVGVPADAVAVRPDAGVIEGIVEIGDFFTTYSIPYFDGEKNPHLELVEGQPDLLSDIYKPKTGPVAKP